MDATAMSAVAENACNQRLQFGIEGLDTILSGGLLPHRSYLVRGGPGCGKTTLGLHFLSEGVKQGERSMFITLGESQGDLKINAASIGIDVCDIRFLDLSPDSSFFTESNSFDLFTPAEMEQDAITKKIIECIKMEKPSRVFLDSTSHLRYLSLDAHRFRHQLLSFIRFLVEQNVTLLFTSECTANCPDDDVMYLSDGVINMSSDGLHRKIEIKKFRGSSSIRGPHTIELTAKGIKVFLAMRFVKQLPEHEPVVIKTGISDIDSLLGGGIETGTVTLITGPAGVGKTTLGIQFVLACLRRGTQSTIFQFEESQSSLLRRTAQINLPLSFYVESGLLRVVDVDLTNISEDEVACLLREEIKIHNSQFILFDSVSGYSLCLSRQHSFLPLRNLFQYLKSENVTTIAINETQSVTGDFKPTEIGISFMADNIVFLRFLELGGAMRKAIGVLKKRFSDFERNLRECAITSTGITIGTPMTGLRGILSGVPEWDGEAARRLDLGREERKNES